MNSATNRNAIAIIGISCWYPGAKNYLELWENILSRRRQFRRIQDVRLPLSDYFDSDPKALDKTYGYQAAVIDGYEYDWIKNRIPKSTYESTDIVHWLAVDVAMKAMEHAGYSKNNIPKEKSGVILGNTLTGEFTRSNSFRLRWPYVRKTLRKTATSLSLPQEFTQVFEKYMEECFKSPFPQVTEDTLAGGLSNTIAGRICNYLDLKGGGYTIDGACSSSLLAVCRAVDCLRNGDLDLVFAGGVDISLDTFEMIGFAKTGALTREEMKVYDKNGSGFIPGEGCGFIVLKRLEDAIADGNYVYAVIRGCGISSDGRGGITAPDSKGQSLALRRAYEKAGYHPSEVAFIEGHGTGTAVGDPIEIEGIVLADQSSSYAPSSLEAHANGKKKKGLTSIKSIIGHTKAAAGIAGLIKATMAVNRRVIPPTAGISQPHPIFSNQANNLYPVMLGEICDPKIKLRAGVSAMGFGGINTHVTLESYDPPSPRLKPAIEERSLLVSNQETEIFLLTAENVTDLSAKAENLAQIARDISLAEMVDLSYVTIQKIERKDKIRVAIMANTPKDLVARLEQVQKMTTENFPAPGEIQSSPLRDIWIGNQVKKDRVGFLCSGQGAQQVNMARTLVERHAWARELMSNANAWVGEIDNKLLSDYIYLPTDQADDPQKKLWKDQLTNTAVAQPAICLASTIWSKKLSDLGFSPLVVSGHSLGELTAFYLAGALNEKELLKLAALRGMAMAAPSDQAGTMLSLGCDTEKARELNKNIQGYWTIANINSPSQTVIAGEKAALQAILEQAKSKGIPAVPLPVSNAFHSKFVQSSAEIVKEKANIPTSYHVTQVKLFSGMDGEQVQDGTVLNEYFSRQITSQVNFIALVKAMAKECDLLIEVGPGNILSNLVRSILDEKQIICLPVESRPGMDRDLNTVIAAYFCFGGNLELNALFENRLVRHFVDPADKNFLVNPCEKELLIPSLAGKKAPNVSMPFGFDNGFFENNGISKETFSQYWAQRGQFIKEIIKSDLRYFENSPAPQLVSTLVNERNAEELIEIETEPELVSEIVESGDLRLTVENRIIELISEKTGFPAESITPEMYLLNDLNMESIKAGELIVNVAKEYNVIGRLDPAPLAQAKIEQVASAIVAAKETMSGGAAGLSDAQVLVNNIEKTTGVKTWVRNFIMRPIEEPFDSKSASLALANHHVLIIHDQKDASTAEKVGAKLVEKGSTIQYANFDTTAQLINHDFSAVIGILPRQADTVIDQGRIIAAVKRLHVLGQIGVGSNHEPSGNGKQRKQIFAIVQFAGGKFGLENQAHLPDQGGSLAFLASIHHEKPHLMIKSLDFAPTITDENLAQCIINELQTDVTYALAGYDENLTRYIVRPVLQDPTQYVERNLQWSSEDVILVSGGARGITAHCAFEVAQKTGAKMALVGSSPLPKADPEEAAKPEILATLDKYQQAGLTGKYYQCDITNAEAVSQVVQTVNQDLGEITGVIHGAGLNTPRFVETVSLEEAQKEVAPKLMGALNLMQALENKPIKLFIGLSSIIGVTGMPGNAWYAFSNETLDLLMRKYQSQHPQTSVLCIAYSVWDEVGMGARMGSIHTLASMGISAIPVPEGLQRFTRLFFSDPGDQQVIVTARLGGLDNWNIQSDLKPTANRFLENVELWHPGIEAAVKVHLDLETHPYLKDHNYEGSYLFPAVFGLEAMAEVVALVTGKQKFNSLVLRNIDFERPIIADPDHGTNILIHALVAEQKDPDQNLSVQVGISVEQTGFAHNHFAAEFLVPVANELVVKPADNKRPTNGSIGIHPKADLYGRLLFQGPLFQRLQEFYALSTVYTECTSEIRKYDSTNGNQEVYILDDPYFRDTILQTGQVIAGRDKALPRRIDRIDIYPVEITDKNAVIIGELIERTDEYWLSIFTVMDKNSGLMRAKMHGCKFTILETRADEPTCDEMAAPDQRDNEILKLKMGQLARELNISLPAAKLFNLPGMHELKKPERRKYLAPVLDQILADFFNANFQIDRPDCKVKWPESGKPEIKIENYPEVQVSLSHDDRLCLATVGASDQGCDIMMITEKAEEDWQALLGPNQADLFAELGSMEKIDYAGARIWAAREALFKAHNSEDLELSLLSLTDKAAIFNGSSADRHYRIVTFPAFFTLGPERMLALVLLEKKIESTTESTTVNLNLFRPNSGVQRENLLQEFGYNSQTYMMDADIDPETMSLIIRWPLTLREAANLSRGIYFATFAEWLGKVREIGTQPINDRLVPLLATGKWGLVTTNSEIEIFGDWTPRDIIQVRLWIMPDSELPKSALNLYYDWLKVTPEGSYERLAFGTLRAAFVEILGHGLVKVTELPDYFQDFIHRMQRPEISVRKIDQVPERLKDLDHGTRLYQKQADPARGPFLCEKIIETSLLDSNMVGNIYFSNYYKWQGIVRDSYFYSLIPDHFHQTFSNCELRCIKTRVDHLRDTMPFAKIIVRMYLNSLFENGCELGFEYFQLLPGGKEIKLAFGNHLALWIDRSDVNLPRAVRLPEKALSQLKSACSQENNSKPNKE